jgi:tetratricopeptide (TPR) repeat protein
MKRSKTAAVVLAGFAACALVTVPAQAADVMPGKGTLESSLNYFQYLFADRAASAALNGASKAAAAKTNVLGLGAARELQIQAEAQMQQRDFLSAEQTLRRALSLAPELASTEALLAVSIEGQGRRAEAISMLEALAKSAADTNANSTLSAKADVLSAVAAAYNSLGDPKHALQIYNQLIAENIDSATVHAGRGEALQRLDEDLAALASFQLAGEVEPRFPNLELKRAQSLEKLGRNSEAENAYRVALQLDPASTAARASVARLEGRRAVTSSDLPASAAVAAPAVMPTTTDVVLAAAPTKEDAPATATKRVVAEKMVPLTAPTDKAMAAPLPSSPKVPSGEAQAAVLAQLGKWQAAWSGKEVETYLSFYAKGFAPVKLNRAAWEADRRVKLNKPGPIQVSIVEPRFELEGGVLKVTFNQQYTSSNFSDKTRKRMDWVQDGGEWRIQREVTL